MWTVLLEYIYILTTVSSLVTLSTHDIEYADCTTGMTWVVMLNYNYCRIILYFPVDYNNKLFCSGHHLHKYVNTTELHYKLCMNEIIFHTGLHRVCRHLARIIHGPLPHRRTLAGRVLALQWTSDNTVNELSLSMHSTSRV